MSHGVVAKQSTYPGTGKRRDPVLLGLLGMLGNRVQQEAVAGTVVAPGGAITPDAALTTTVSGSRIKVSATASFQFPKGTTSTPFITRSVNGGPPVTVWNWAQNKDQPPPPSERDVAAVFFDSVGLPAGDVLTYHWQTAGGDGAATIGGGSAGPVNAACLLVEELPA